MEVVFDVRLESGDSGSFIEPESDVEAHLFNTHEDELMDISGTAEHEILAVCIS